MNIEEVLTNEEVDFFLDKIKGGFEYARDHDKEMVITLNVEVAQKLSFCLLELQGFRKLAEARPQIQKPSFSFLGSNKEELILFKTYETVPAYLLDKNELAVHKYLVQQNHIQKYLKSK